MNTRWDPRCTYVLVLVLGALLPAILLQSSVGILFAVGFGLGKTVYTHLWRARQTRWFVLGWLLTAILVAAVDYGCNLVLFPHSPRSGWRLQDACAGGLLTAVGGMVLGWSNYYVAPGTS